MRRFPSESEMLFELVLSLFNSLFQRLASIAFTSLGYTDVVFVGNAVELGVEIADQVIIEGVRLVACLGIRGYDFVRNYGSKVGEHKLLLPPFESVGEVDTGAFLCVKAIAGLVELEADFHMGDSVGGHHEFVAV